MELEKIQKVEYATDEERINQRLAQGWVILNTAAGQDYDAGPHILVLLGLPKKD